MSTDDSVPEKLIRDIKRFLEREREMYGDFYIDLPGMYPDERAAREDQETQSVSTASTRKNADKGEREEAASEPDTLPDRLETCTTLEELETLCREADMLKTDLQGTNLVFGVGNPDADLMLIGEAPGAEEDRLGEPFVGKAGQLLNKILSAIDFEREDVYIANILKHRPPNNRNPKPEERERSLPFLLKQIELVDPKLILSLGKISAQTLLNSDDTLGNMRGTFHPFLDGRELLATYHPAALLRNAKWKRPTWEDVQKLRRRYDELGCTP
ncbi:MAG: uracil-DNA glycosylase [Balneolaceae bacterium]|nr:uracil-DNA glycosylase [Balneolaceae bacterium]